MPGPIRGNSPQPLTTISEPEAPATPTAPAPAETPVADGGWKAKAHALGDKVVDKAKDAAVKEASKEHTIRATASTTGNGVELYFRGKLSEQVALKESDTLVAGDPRRAKAAAAGDTTWTKLTVGAEAGGAYGHAVAPGLTASLGFAAGAYVSAIVPTDKDLSVKNLKSTLERQGEGVMLALDPKRLLEDSPVPGTELLVRGRATETASLGLGASASAGPVTANVGLTVSSSHTDEYIKNIKVLGDGRFYAEVSKLDSNSQGVAFGADAGVRGLRLRATVGASGTQTDSLRIGGVFDLKTPQGREAFEYLMKANPLELEANQKQAQTTLVNMGMGAAYADKTSSAGVSANIQIGSAKLLSFSSARRTTEGVLMETTGEGGDPKKTQLSEAEYKRNVGGALPRLMVGEERTVAVRAGAIVKDGVETRAAVASLTLQDPKVSGEEQRQIEAFARQMGVEVPAATKEGGKGKLSVQVALTEENLQKLHTRSADDIRTAFSFAKGAIEAETAPWDNESLAKKNPNYRDTMYKPARTVKEEFIDGNHFYRDSSGNQGGGDDVRSRAVRDYRATTGRELPRDAGSYDAMNAIAEEVIKVRGKPVTEWGPALAAIGKQSSVDVRTSLVALNRLAGASLVSLEIEGNGLSVQARPGPAPKSIAEYVGPILLPE